MMTLSSDSGQNTYSSGVRVADTDSYTRTNVCIPIKPMRLTQENQHYMYW